MIARLGYRHNAGAAFREIARRAGDATALAYPDNSRVSYSELSAMADRIAATLVARGVRRHDVVGIVHSKSPSCFATMLACLKLGAPYVNIDEQNPPPRLGHIFASCRPVLVIGDRISDAVRQVVSETGIAFFDFCDPSDAAELSAVPAPERHVRDPVTGADPAYIMYTSGSTGTPKGAIITHANVLNFADWCATRFDIGPGDVLSNVNPMHFDNSVFDFYAAVLNGAALVPVLPDVVAQPERMLAQLEEAGCTVWFSVPSLLIYLTTLKLLSADRLPAVRAFVFGGEGYPKPELRKLFAAFGARSRLINVYGPTECTCICSAWDVRREDLEDVNGFVTLGPLADNFSGLVLDEDNCILEPGETGELCLLGPQVGLGYVNDAERTARAFVANPANDAWPERMYRTGDLVRVQKDGETIDFVGRKDNQIKHMGYRIELEEIEMALNQIPGVVQSAVLQVAARRDMKVLVACVVSDAQLTQDELREQLAAYLPPYMLPQRFVVRPDLPKNANGKVDRLALAREVSEVSIS
jgi:D-alanine--poly(phosphoribitol) ligase subunit 1